MKVVLVLVGVILLCSGESIPAIPGDNSHYVEGVSRYIWMPDGEGNPILVDLHEPVDKAVVKTRNGANNQYWLFTRSNPNNHQLIVHGDANTIWSSNYRADRPLKVIVHGWKNTGNTAMNPLITSAFLAVLDANVIVVDWRRLADSLYNVAAAGVPDVGRHLGEFLVWLISTAGGDWNNVHLVGFSLGAHVIASAGRTAGSRCARITGLDPAGPNWGSNHNALSPNAGQYVEAIHTDGNLLGIFFPLAHADFYPNGGKNPQPGCNLSTCSHGRSTELFASSVRTSHLIGRQCPNVWEAELSTCFGTALPMGNALITKVGRGIFSLRTGSSWPF